MNREHGSAVQELRDADRRAQQSVIARDTNAVLSWLAEDATNYGPFAPAAEGREAFLHSFEDAFALPGFAVNYPEPSKVHVSPGGNVGNTPGLDSSSFASPRCAAGESTVVHPKENDDATQEGSQAPRSRSHEEDRRGLHRRSRPHQQADNSDGRN
jgi:hypothetical protein